MTIGPRPRFAHFGVLLVSLVLTVAGTVAFRRAVEERDAARFRNEVESTLDRIGSRLDAYITILIGARALVAAAPIDRQAFRRYAEKLELQRLFPGVQAIGYLEHVTGDRVLALEEEMRRQGFADFSVWPEGARAEMYPILYIEPLDRRNRVALGYDMFSEPVRREAMERARDTRRPAASRRVTLVQEIDEQKQRGFLIYVAVFDANDRLRGFVYTPFRVDDLFAGIFGREKDPRVEFEVYDGEAVSPTLLIHRSQRSAAREPRFETVAGLEVAGRRWTTVFRSKPAFEQQSGRRLVPIFFAIGLFTSLVLFWVSRGQSRAHRDAETARAEAQAERDNLHTLFMQTPAAVAIVRGGDYRYELSNPVNQELTWGRAVAGRTVEEAMPEAEAKAATAMLKTVFTTGEAVVVREIPIRVRDAEGRERDGFFSGTYQPLRDRRGEMTGVMVFAYEVTDQVRARMRVEALADDLKRMTDDLRKAVRARDDFMAIAGHELRTPVAALLLQIQGLERQLKKGAPTPRLAERLGKAAVNVMRLDVLIGELLDVSRISSGRLALQIEEMDLSGLTAEVVDRFSEAARDAGCELRVKMPERVTGRWDRTRLDQVLTNLISNAIKYGRERPVEITIEADSSRAKIVVRDFGIGIAREHRDRIFERFERAVSEHHYGGLGLGLWISRQIVEALGGRISVDDAEGEGSAFTVELPRA